MMYRHGFFASCALLGLGGCMSAPAHTDDLSARQVWQAWQEVAADSGQTLSGTVTMQGDTLVIDQPTISLEKFITGVTPVKFSFSISRVRLTEMDDGTVQVDMPDKTPLDLGLMDEAPLQFGQLRLANERIVISGTPKAMTYDVAVDSLRMNINAGLLDDSGRDDRLQISQKDLSASYTLTKGTNFHISGGLESGPISVVGEIVSGVSGRQSVKAEFASFEGKMNTTLAKEPKNDSMPAKVRAGWVEDSQYRLGAGRISVRQAMGLDTTWKAGSTYLSAFTSAKGLEYGLVQKGVQLVVSGRDLPRSPIEGRMQELRVAVAAPTIATRRPADIGLNLAIRDLTLSPRTWATIDPKGALPRDPGTFVLDLSGKARMPLDLLDPEKRPEITKYINNGNNPVEVSAVNLDKLQLEIAGAALGGSGRFTFDNDDLETMRGLPAPSGKATLTLEGAGVLISNLIAGEIISARTGMGMHAMLGMFTRPGPDEGQRLSEIVVRNGDEVLINGKPLP